MKNNKPALILAGAIAALFVITFVIRFVALSELGMPGGWMLYFGLPVGGIGLDVIQAPKLKPRIRRYELRNLTVQLSQGVLRIRTHAFGL